MSDRLEAVKAQFDAMIERMKEECYRRVDLEMEVLMEMWREEKRLKMKKKKTSRGRAVKRMKKAAEDGHESDDNADAVSVKSEIDSDECGCDSDDEDNSNFEVKEELTDEDGENTTAPVPSTSRGRKRKATPTRQVATKKRRITPPVDNQRQESTAGSGKMRVLTINCTVEACQRTFRCVHKIREHLLAVHQVKPFQCRAQGCGQQFDKIGEFSNHGRAHPRATTWLCPHCPGKTFTSSNNISTHIFRWHQAGQFQCAIDQCQFTATTRGKVLTHQRSTHSTVQLTCPFKGCTKVFKKKQHLIRHQLIHTSTTPFHCTFLNCRYKGKERSKVVRHIRTVHFKLPATLNEQHRRGIVDDRNHNDFIEVDQEALALYQS